MSDTQEINVSKKDWNGAYVPKHSAKLVKAAVENSTAPFIPQNGQVATPLIINANTGFALDAKDMIPAILTKVEKGYKSNVVGTFATAGKAETRVKEKEKGLYVNFKNKETGEWNHTAYFFGEQMKNPEKFAEFASKQKVNQQQNLKGEKITAFSPEVTAYLGAYIAACKSGATFEAAPDIAEKFKVNMLAVAGNELARTVAEKKKDIPGITEVFTNAGKKADEIIKTMEKNRGIGQEKKQEKNQEFKPQHNKRKSKEMTMSM